MCPVFIEAKEVAFMRRNEVLQEYRNMRFEKVYTGWKSRELTQDEELSYTKSATATLT